MDSQHVGQFLLIAWFICLVHSFLFFSVGLAALIAGKFAFGFRLWHGGPVHPRVLPGVPGRAIGLLLALPFVVLVVVFVRLAYVQFDWGVFMLAPIVAGGAGLLVFLSSVLAVKVFGSWGEPAGE